MPNDPDINVVGDRLSYMFYGGAGFMTLLFILVIICKYNSSIDTETHSHMHHVEHTEHTLEQQQNKAIVPPILRELVKYHIHKIKCLFRE